MALAGAAVSSGPQPEHPLNNPKRAGLGVSWPDQRINLARFVPKSQP